MSIKAKEYYRCFLSGKFEICETTHPVIALLDHPLFACGEKKGVKRLIFSFPVSREASDESGQNMVACATAGALANLAEVGV